MSTELYWHDVSDHTTHLMSDRGYTLATAARLWDGWVVTIRGSLVGKYDTEEEAKAVALVTIRMNQPNETEVFVEASRRRGVYIGTPRRP